MKKKLLTVFIAGIAVSALVLTSCNEMNDFSVSQNHHLAFSADTLTFDTVFTSIGSTTGYFMIYNRNDKALNIESITLASGGSKGFRINIDGRKGDQFNDIPVWKKDSLFVAVEVTVNPNDDSQPFVIYDSVIFVTNGLKQAVVLEAYGQNAHILKGGVAFDHDAVLTPDLPYLVFDSVKVSDGVTLEIAKGTTFYMHKNARWIIEGRIIASGTLDEPVTFRGDRIDNLSRTISYDRLSSQWDGIWFRANSFDNELNYTMIRNGVSGLTFDESTPERKKITFGNCRITNMDGNLFWAENCNIEAFNSEFSNASDYLMLLAGGIYRFTHCTIVNYMPGKLMSNGAARVFGCLTLSDNVIYYYQEGKVAEKHVFPLQQAYFDNCIIDGSLPVDNEKDHDGELFFSTDEDKLQGDDASFNYRFNHCYIKTKGIAAGDRFIDVIYEGSPSYIKSDATNSERLNDFIYDFRLAENSLGIGKADRSISEKYPVDFYGISRLDGENAPTIGAYEYVKQEKSDE
ncbi:MAG: hypothetical protein LBR18_08015 [Tannerella sp.]|jgi:hypothetical protein|nr:hypothetical protein [Tannerella sp.]